MDPHLINFLCQTVIIRIIWQLLSWFSFMHWFFSRAWLEFLKRQLWFHLFFCFPSFCSSLHFMGIYLLRCLITHVTGSIKLTDTSRSWRLSELAAVGMGRLLQRRVIYAACIFHFVCVLIPSHFSSKDTIKLPLIASTHRCSLRACPQKVSSKWTCLFSQRN